MIHRYRLDITPHMNVVNRGMIGNIKTGEWVKYEDHIAEVEKLRDEILLLNSGIITLNERLEEVTYE